MLITYAHKDDPKGVRYRQHSKDSVPSWAVDIQPERIDYDESSGLNDVVKIWLE